jgi:hypothetical protein
MGRGSLFRHPIRMICWAIPLMALAIPAIAQTASSTQWIYYAGVMSWPGDWSWDASVNYNDVSGAPTGDYDISVNVTGGWGGWQPYAPNQAFNTAGSDYLIFSLKPTVANQVWAVAFHSADGSADGYTLKSIAQYGPPGGPVVGQWGTYEIPLSAFGLTNQTINSFYIQNQSGTGLFYVNNVGFYSGKVRTTSSSTPSGSGGSSPPSDGSTAWVYYNGVFDWPGDWSANGAVPNYKDTSGDPLSGSYDIAVTTPAGAGGLWQPYINSACQTNTSLCFNTAPYKHLIFSIKPTNPNSLFASNIHSSGDTPDGIYLSDLSAYCSGGSNPPVNQWESCSIPLSAYGLTDPLIVKFEIQATSAETLFYIDNVGFTTD